MPVGAFGVLLVGQFGRGPSGWFCLIFYEAVVFGAHRLQCPRAGRIQLILEAGDHAGFFPADAAQFIKLPLQLLFGLDKSVTWA